MPACGCGRFYFVGIFEECPNSKTTKAPHDQWEALSKAFLTRANCTMIVYHNSNPDVNDDSVGIDENDLSVCPFTGETLSEMDVVLHSYAVMSPEHEAAYAEADRLYNQFLKSLPPITREAHLKSVGFVDEPLGRVIGRNPEVGSGS
jgi:hypothetical protein